MVQVWDLMRSRDGAFVELHEVPAWALALQGAGEKLSAWLCTVSRQRACCNPPEWMFRLHWGRAEEDPGTDETYYPHNLGYYVWELSTKLELGPKAAWQRKGRIDVPVSEEFVRANFPDAGWPFIDDEDDGMRSAPQDDGEVRL
jgi:hypothetical protein